MDLPASAPPPNDPSFARMRTWCPDCGGNGDKYEPRFGIIAGVPGSIMTTSACRTCKGTGRLKGFQPPA